MANVGGLGSCDAPWHIWMMQNRCSKTNREEMVSFVLRMTRKNQGSVSSLQKTLRNSLKLVQLGRRKLHKSHSHPIDLTAALVASQ